MLSHSIITTRSIHRHHRHPSSHLGARFGSLRRSELEEDVPKPQGATPTESRATLAQPSHVRRYKCLLLLQATSWSAADATSSYQHRCRSIRHRPSHPIPHLCAAVNNITTNHLDLNEGDTNHFLRTTQTTSMRYVALIRWRSLNIADAKHDNKLDALGKRPRGEIRFKSGHSPPSKPPAKRITGGGRSWANKVRGGEAI